VRLAAAGCFPLQQSVRVENCVPAGRHQEWRALFDRSGLMLEEVVGLQSFGNILVVLRPRE
jgi:hypothetical protein